MPIPGRIEAAMDFIRHCDNLRNPAPSCDGVVWPSRDLTRKEAAVESAALDCLLGYFTGELDYGDDAPNSSATADPPESED